MKFLAPLAFLALVGCTAGDSGAKSVLGYSEDAYADDYIAATCAKAVECYGDTTMSAMPFSDEASCVEYYNSLDTGTATTTVEYTYDEAKAQECVDGMNALTCEDLMGGNYPAACTEVYTAE